MKTFSQSGETVTADLAVKVDSLHEVLKIAQTHAIVCISARTEANSSDQDARAKATEDLETLIAASYDYITVNCRWVSPLENGSTQETVAENFIVIGPEHGEPPERTAAFRTYMIELCDRYHQWAILYLSWAKDHAFAEEKYKDRDHLELHELYGEYLNSSGNTIKTFDTVDAGMIGSYFTATAKKAGAAGSVLLAPMRFYAKYTPTSLANKFITMRGDDHSVEQKRKVIMACRFPESSYWRKTKDTYHSYIHMETKWHWGEFRSKHAPWNK